MFCSSSVESQSLQARELTGAAQKQKSYQKPEGKMSINFTAVLFSQADFASYLMVVCS